MTVIICGARTKNGPCQNTPILGKLRCWRHGAASTGPRTESGKAKRAACASATAILQWQDARAQGQNQIGDRPAASAANKGWAKPEAQRGRMSRSQRKRRDREALGRNVARVAEITGIRAPKFELLEASQ
jgi:hypothetical protein